jgi:hypothetical protein
MKSGPQQKGSKAVSPTRGRSPNQPAAPFVQKGKANSYFSNSRTPVHSKFDRHPHVGSKKEKD